MTTDEKIKLLEGMIAELATEINTSRAKLDQLRSELNALKTSHAPGVISAEPNAVSRPPVSAAPGLENFIGLKLIHVVGIIVLVTGLSIGVKYAVDEQLISEWMRIALAYAAGILLFIISARLKTKYKLFSAILFSGSMASLYFTTYGASVYYYFFPALVAFVIMAGLTVYTVIMAIQYNSKEIGIIGMIGAYAIPFLVSANNDRSDLFFSYIFLINTGVVYLSFKRSWKLMDQLALLITWALFIGWCFIRYETSEKFIAILFMILYYVQFSVAALAFPFSRKIQIRITDAWQVIINHSALYFAAILVFSYGIADTSIATVTGIMFLFTAMLAVVSARFFFSAGLLQQSLIRQSILYLLLFIAFQWDGLAVTLLWIAVAVLLFLWGIYRKMAWVRLASVLLVGITLVKLLLYDSASFSTVQKIISYLLIGALLLLFSWYYQKFGLAGKKLSDQ